MSLHTTNPKTCKHCGTDFRPSAPDEDFCCAGCAYVYRLINERELDRYYDLKDRITPPVGTRVFNEDNWSWLDARAKAAENTAKEQNRPATLSIAVQGISCTACVWLVEKIFEEKSGSIDIQLDVRYGQLKLQWQPEAFNVIEFAQELKALGYILCPEHHNKSHESRALVLKLGLCAAFAMNTMFASLPGYLGMEDDFLLADSLSLITMFFSTLSMLVGGLYFIRRAWSSLQLGTIHMDVPIAIGLCAAYVGSIGGWLIGREDLVYFDFVSVFVLLMLFGRWMQDSVLEHNRNRYLDRYDIAPKINRFDASGNTLEIPIEAIEAGHNLQIQPNALIPVTARLESGEADINLQCINGEQETRKLHAGELLPSGGQYCGSTPLIAQAQEPWKDSLLARLVANSGDSFKNAALDRTLRIYLLAVMAIALLGGIYWWWTSGIVNAMQVAISVLVVSCPCAIGVALPLLDEMMIVGVRQRGLYIRNENIWTKLRQLRHLVFDKTGTLTLEKPALENPAALDELSEKDRSLLATLVRNSLHPLSRSLNQALASRFPSSTVQSDTLIEEIPGSGLLWQRDDGRWTLGKPGWESAFTPHYDLAFACNGVVIAGFSFLEKPREASRELTAKLTQEGYALKILSGDRDEKVQALAKALNLPSDTVLARQSPDDKAHWIRRHADEGVLMVGDGLNDSLALNEARCSGVVVTDLNILGHKADFLVMGSAMRGVADLLNALRVRDRGVWVLFIFNILYNLTVVALALAGMMNPLIAAIVMPLSSVASTILAFGAARSGS